jgi:hypothetical protein
MFVSVFHVKERQINGVLFAPHRRPLFLALYGDLL